MKGGVCPQLCFPCAMRVVQFPANADRALREHLHMRISHWLYKGQIPFSFSLRGCKAHQSAEAMAEAPDLRDKSLEELEEEITCAVCHGHYQEAKLLPCMHYYCRECIEKLAERSRGRPFPCPECRKDTSLPSGGAEQLQSAFFVERMKEVYGKIAKAEGKVEAVCGMCSGGTAIGFCHQCAEFLCSECTRSHQKMKVFASHKVSTLEDLKKGGVLDIPLKEAPPPKCPEHDDQLMTLFCFDCNRLICRDCTVIDHNGHKFNFLKKCATESRKSLRDSLTPLRKVQASITGADKKLVATEAQVDTQEKEVCQTIKQSFAQLKAVLERRETELLNKAVTLAREKKDALMAQRKGLQMAETEIQSLVEFVERNVENTSDQDLMVIHTQLQAKMEEEEKRHQQLSLEPATTADITYDSPSPDTIPRDLGVVFRLPQVCEVGDLSSIQLGKPSKLMTVKTPGHQNPTIQAELKSLADPASSVQADVIQKGVEVYNITCTPRVRGQHDLTVKVNGKDIVGSPFRVFVKIHPTQLGPPVRTITGVSQPWGIALNNKQQLVVGELGKVLIMERDGKRVQTIKCDKCQQLHGVATGPDGAIYVTDSSAQCLLKFSEDCRLLKTVQNELICPLFIKTIKDRLYVSDHDNNLVKIFDSDCSIIGTIPINECPEPEDIAEGDDGLYVVGGDKIGVYSCAPNGDFIRHLNIQPSSVKLSCPIGISFDCSGHLFVTQAGSGVEGVYVFTPSGQHVTSFGLASSGVSIEYPAGIVIDEDGFVYVCDCSSSKIFVF